jgi:hypothetical protein
VPRRRASAKPRRAGLSLSWSSCRPSGFGFGSRGWHLAPAGVAGDPSGPCGSDGELIAGGLLGEQADERAKARCALGIRRCRRHASVIRRHAPNVGQTSRSCDTPSRSRLKTRNQRLKRSTSAE